MTKSNGFLFVKNALFILVLVLFASCDKEFNTIGTDLVGNDDFLFETKSYDVNYSNQNTGVVQSNGLPINALGIYTNSLGQTTTANFVTQLELASEDPTIDLSLHQEIESVTLSIPYFSTFTGYSDDGTLPIYELDSIYGGSNSKLKLSIYESGYFMRDVDPSTQTTQLYYSDQNNVFDSAKKTLLNTDADVSQNEEFFFSNADYDDSTTSDDGTVTTKRTKPEMRINLDKEFFKNKFFTSSATSNLVTNNAFKNYFRGLYFKVENSTTSETNQMLINFKLGKITIKYKEDLSTTDQTEAKRVEKSIVLNLTGNSASLLKNSSASIVDSKNIYLKGGEGSIAFINLFNPTDADGNGVSDEIDELRDSNILINDATLTVYVNQTAMANAAYSPNRLYLFDSDNNKQLLDYDYDSSVSTNKKYDKLILGGVLDEVTSSYKIKLTHHIRNLILNDTVTNVRLGLAITENINDISSKKLKTPLVVGTKSATKIPTSSVMSPLNTILYGNTDDVPLEKKIKFEIYYTKPN